MPAHTHSINIDSAEVGAVQQNIGINNEDGTGSTGTTGGDNPHNNMQPYLGGNYIIKV
jgi:hypothetical protein